MKMLYARYHVIRRAGSLDILPAVIPRPAPGPLGQMGPLCISQTFLAQKESMENDFCGLSFSRVLVQSSVTTHFYPSTHMDQIMLHFIEGFDITGRRYGPA